MQKMILIGLFGLMFSQTELTTRTYSVLLESDLITVDLHELTGYDFDFAHVNLFGISDCGCESNCQSGRFRLMNGGGMNEWNEYVFSPYYCSYDEYNYPEKFLHYQPGTYNDAQYNLILQITNNHEGIDYINFLIAITTDFPDEDAGIIENLQSQIDALVEQLTGCVDCQGDLNESQHTSVTDIVLLVEHILGSESGECYTN